jgi:hypothetical protein
MRGRAGVRHLAIEETQTGTDGKTTEDCSEPAGLLRRPRLACRSKHAVSSTLGPAHACLRRYRGRNNVMTSQERTDRGGVAAPGDRPALSVNVYVDGFNLYYGCLKGTAYMWLDIGALCRRLVPANPINRIRYFTSRISARPDAPDGPAQQDAYLRALATIDGLNIHLGHFQSPKVRLPVADPSPDEKRRTVEVIKTQEKGSDVNLATFLLLDAFRHESGMAVVVSNDSDLAEPIRVLIQELGVPVGLVNPHPAKYRSRDLLQLGPLFFKQVRPSALRDCQLPRVLQDTQGEIRRPDAW